MCSSDLFGRAALITLPYLVLHREEFAWPRVSPPAPVRSYIKPLRAAPFHPSPSFKFEISNLKFQIKTVGWSVFCCTCRRRINHRFEISQSEIKSDAPPLAGSLPFGVRTFLSFVLISDFKSEI